MFESYPNIRYSLTTDGKTLTDFLLTDITVRAHLMPSDEQLQVYEVQPGEFPDMVSYKMYGTPNYHWTVMMVNNIFDPFSEWVMDDITLYEYVKEKYDVVHTVDQASGVDTTNNRLYIPGHKFKVNDKVTLVSSELMPEGLSQNTDYYISYPDTDYVYLTPVLNNTPMVVTASTNTDIITTASTNHLFYDGLKGKFLTSGVLPAPLQLGVPYYVKVINDEQFYVATTPAGDKINLTTSGTGVLQFRLDPIEIESAGFGTLTITCSKVDEPHSFVDPYGNVTSSSLMLNNGWSADYATREDFKNALTEIINNQPSRYSFTSATNKQVTKNEDGTISVVELPTEIANMSEQITTMTNYDYESRLNDQKKRIYVIKPQYINDFVNRFNQLVSQ